MATINNEISEHVKCEIENVIMSVVIGCGTRSAGLQENAKEHEGFDLSEHPPGVAQVEDWRSPWGSLGPGVGGGMGHNGTNTR